MTYDISKAAEAGFYLEYKLFESVVKLIIPSKPGRSVFNKYTQINGKLFGVISKLKDLQENSKILFVSYCCFLRSFNQQTGW